MSFGAAQSRTQAQEYVVLNRELHIKDQLPENVRGGTPRLLCAPDRTEINVIDDDLIMLSPFNYYSNEIGSVIFLH